MGKQVWHLDKPPEWRLPLLGAALAGAYGAWQALHTCEQCPLPPQAERWQIVILGGGFAFHNIPGLREHSFPMKRLGDTDVVRNRVLALLERANAEPDPAVRCGLLTFVVGGGGFTVVETMAAINDLVRDSVRFYPHVPPTEIRTILIHPGDRLLPELSPSLGAYAQKKLQQRGVEVLLKTEINGADPGYVDVAGGQQIAAQTRLALCSIV